MGSTWNRDGVIYARVMNNGLYEWVVLNNDDDDVPKPSICYCGAMATLHPCLPQPSYDGNHPSAHRFPLQSTVASVGSKIYVFGGIDLDSNDRNLMVGVSYIDTLCPQDGWKVCNPMVKPRKVAYAAPLGDGRLLLAGGYKTDPDLTYAQIFDPRTDTWSALHNFPSNSPHFWNGHAVVNRGSVLLHCYGLPELYSYDADSDLWGLRFGAEFGAQKHAGALVDGIYYVVHNNNNNTSLCFSGYDVTLEYAERLPVEILLEQDKVEEEGWLPPPDLPPTHLLPLGNNQLASVWSYLCAADTNTPSQFLK